MRKTKVLNIRGALLDRSQLGKYIEKIARDKKTGANGKRARKILGISDEEVETKDDSTSEKSTDKKNTEDKSNKLQTKSDSSKAEAKPTDVNKKSELDAK